MKSKVFIKDIHWIFAVVGSLLMWIVIGIISGNLNLNSLTANMTSAAFLGIAALGQMMVITTGRGAIDLSIPNVITLSAFLTMGIIDGNNARMPLGLLAVLGVGVLVGMLNSFLVIWLKITPMIATLAVGYIVSSVVSIYNRSFNTMKVCSILGDVVKKRLFNIPLIVYLVLLLGMGIYLVFRYMTYGKALLALGQNKTAAYLAGIRVNQVEMIAYVSSGMLAALAGFFLSARVGGAFLGMGDSYMLDTVGSVVIGGSLIAGGRAVTFGTLAGGLFLSLLVTAMQVANFAVGVQNIIKGILIIFVLVLSTTHKEKD